MPAIQSSAVIDKNEDGSDITQDVDVRVWWRDVGQARFPRIAVMARQFLAIPAASATAERVFSFAGLTLSDLRKSLVEGTLEAIMWAKWGSPSIPLGRGDLHITHPQLCAAARTGTAGPLQWLEPAPLGLKTDRCNVLL